MTPEKPPAKKSRLFYIGDFKEQNVSQRESQYRITVNQVISRKQKQIKTLQQKNRRLVARIARLKSSLKPVKHNSMVGEESSEESLAQTNLIEDTQSEHSDSPFLQEVEEFEDIICESPITVKTEPTITTLKRKSPSISSIEPLPKIRQVFTESEVDHLMPDAHQKTTDISDNIASTSSEDIYDIFGKYVATMLRSIGPPTALRLQETITSTMINAMCSFQTNCNQSTGATSKGDSNHY
ncbi:uncharacterized protein LOC123316991 isoform X2 [Coccinella septempunctata]|uniref:uncharacterized protein LOC123316991 isoform X2 n=1 Tax=Coccinella septempunctata TaxID=41139 RepID=UPI001D082A0C|nr:uncharacterized protein LOC123316991 isoform X2 [Coccinella septempunctata]